MAFDAFTGSVQVAVQYNAQKNAPSSSLNLSPTVNSGTVQRKASYTLGGNTAGAMNEVATNIVSITSGGSFTIDLTNLTDVLGYTGVTLVRLKEFLFWLLSTTDDTVNGTACTSVSIGGAAANPNQLDLGSTTATRILLNGDATVYATKSAAGLTVSTTAKSITITNLDGAHAAGVLYHLGGATV
jgi:hypothetical protein